MASLYSSTLLPAVGLYGANQKIIDGKQPTLFKLFDAQASMHVALFMMGLGAQAKRSSKGERFMAKFLGERIKWMD